MSLKMACIVEGHGDREAVPVLIRRLASKQDPAMIIHIPPPIRIPKNKLLKPGELERPWIWPGAGLPEAGRC